MKKRQRYSKEFKLDAVRLRDCAVNCVSANS